MQRQEMQEDEELQMKSLVQRRENIGGGEASTDLESSIQSARGSGQSLDANLQRSMGQAMGADFSGVKVHTDSQSDQLNQSIQAKAFTTGQDVFFRQGAYEPSSQGGQELIAHELTHVVQQNGGAVQRSPQQTTTSSVGDERIQREDGSNPEQDGVEITAGSLSYKDGVVTIPIFGNHKHEIGRSRQAISTEKLPEDQFRFAFPMPKFEVSIDIPCAPGLYVATGFEITPKFLFEKIEGTYSITTGDEKTLSINKASLKGTLGLDIQAKAGVGVGVANLIGLEGGVFGSIHSEPKAIAVIDGTVNFSTSSSDLNLSLNAFAEIVGTAGMFVRAKVLGLAAEQKYKVREGVLGQFLYNRQNALGKDNQDQSFWPKISDFQSVP